MSVIDSRRWSKPGEIRLKGYCLAAEVLTLIAKVIDDNLSFALVVGASLQKNSRVWSVCKYDSARKKVFLQRYVSSDLPQAASFASRRSVQNR